MIYQEIITYSPMIDAQVARLSVAGPRGAEYFSMVKKPASGREWKVLREKVLDTIETEMPTREPGEIQVFDEKWQG